MIDVGSGGGPAVIEIAEALQTEVGGDLLFGLDFGLEIASGDVFEVNFAGAADIKSDGTIAALVVGGIAAWEALGSVEDGAEDVGVDMDFEGVPVRFQRRSATAGTGRSTASTATRRSSDRPATTGRGKTGNRGILESGLLGDTILAAGGLETLARGFHALGIELNGVRGKVAVSEGEVDAAHAGSGLLHTHEDAGFAAGGTAEGAKESGILERFIQHQPAPGGGFRGADEFPIFGFPGGLPEGFQTGEGGLLALHTAVICFDAHPIWKQLTGASWNWSASSHPPVGEFEVSITAAGSQHPVTAQAQNFLLADELYGFLDQVPDLIPLLTAPYLGVEQPLLWAQSIGSGRVVTDLLGHSVESLSNATHQDVLTRAAFWAARDPQRVDAEQVRSA